MNVLKWLQIENFHWKSKQTCAAAASENQLDVLKWLRSHGCPWDASTWQAAVNAQLTDEYPTLRSRVENVDSELLRWLRNQGCPEPEYTGYDAFASDDDDIYDTEYTGYEDGMIVWY